MTNKSSNKGLVFDIRRFSIHDGPGIRTTVFFKGCPLSCTWCHNPESQAAYPELWLRANRCIRCGECLLVCEAGAISLNDQFAAHNPEKCTLCGACVQACANDAREIVGRELDVDQVMEVVERDIPFYDESGGGVTISGGEPFLQHQFLGCLLSACREKSIHTAVDTSGCVRWEVLDRLRPLVDLFLYDLKLMDDARHRQFTGVSNRVILENLKRLAGAGHTILLRLPVIPDITDDEANLRQIGSFAKALPGLVQLDLLPYHSTAATKYQRMGKDYSLSQLESPTRDHMEAVAARLMEFGVSVNPGSYI